MEKVYLQEAFKALDDLNEDVFNIGPISGIKSLKEFMEEDDSLEDEVDIIDDEAETEDDIHDSYIGNVILDCKVCHSKVYKKPEDVSIDKTNGLANTDEECPFCYAADGYEIIGEVAPYTLDKNPEAVDKIVTPDTASLDEDTFDNYRKYKKQHHINAECLRESLEALPDDFDWSTVDQDAFEIFKGRVWDKFAAIRHIEVEPNVQGSMGSYNWWDDDGFCFGIDAADEDDILILAYLNNDIDEGVAALDDSVDRYIFLDRDDDYYDEDEVDESLKEGFEKVDIETDNETMSMSVDENGKVTVTTEPKSNFINSDDFEDENYGDIEDLGNSENDEVIAPVSDKIQSEINPTYDLEDTYTEEDSSEKPKQESLYKHKIHESEDINVDIEDFDEKTFDELQERFLKKNYSNVECYKTSRLSTKNDKLMIEGLITFKNGHIKTTKFVFEGKDINRKGRCRMIGENLNLQPGHKIFTLSGNLNAGQFVSESLNYNFRTLNEKNEKVKVYGNIKLNESLKEAKSSNLSDKENSISSVLLQNKKKIDNSTSKEELVNIVKDALEGNTGAKAKQLITNLQGKKDHLKALQYIYDFILKGDNQGSIEKEFGRAKKSR